MKSKVFALPIGREIVFWDYDKQEYVTRNISKEYAMRLVEYTNQAIANWIADAPEGLSPTYPPIIEEHEMEGKRFGDILQAELMGEGDKYGVYLLVDWLDSKWEDIQENKSQHVSIGTLANYVDYKGRNYPAIINELSLVGSPRLKDIGKIQDTLSLRLADAIPQVKGEEMDQAELLALLDAMLKRVEALEAAMAAFNEKMAKEEPEVEIEAEDKKHEDEEVKAEDMPADEKEDEIVAQLADQMIKKAEKVAMEKLKGMRLGDAPAAKAPVAQTQDKLAAAKAKGLSGLDAIKASLS